MLGPEARKVLDATIQEYRKLSYDELLKVFDGIRCFPVKTESGEEYLVEIQAVWDDKRKRDVRILFLISPADAPFSSSMSDSFIMAPDGTFIGESPHQ